MSEVYFCFLHSQLYTFEKQIKKVEKSSITVIEVKLILEETKKIIIERKQSNFIGLQTRQILNRLKKDPENNAKVEYFENEVKEFFATAVEYIEKWSQSFQKYDVFNWMYLNHVPEWEEIEKSLFYLQEKKVSMGNADMYFDQFVYLKDYMEKNNVESDTDTSMQDKWLQFFAKTKHIEQKSGLLKFCEYIFSIPAHNANVERIFSLMTTQWTDERNKLAVETVEGILQCHYNFKMTCSEFYIYVKGEKELIKSVKSTAKYDWSK